MAAFKRMCKIHGGPRQYVDKLVASAADKRSFSEFILATTPMKQDLEYHTTFPLPAVSDDAGGSQP